MTPKRFREIESAFDRWSGLSCSAALELIEAHREFRDLLKEARKLLHHDSQCLAHPWNCANPIGKSCHCKPGKLGKQIDKAVREEE